jgi:hypothetical protein
MRTLVRSGGYVALKLHPRQHFELVMVGESADPQSAGTVPEPTQAERSYRLSLELPFLASDSPILCAPLE